MLKYFLSFLLLACALDGRAADFDVASSMMSAGADELALAYMLDHPQAKPDGKWNELEFRLLSKFGRDEQALKIAKTLPFSKENALLAANSALSLKKPEAARSFLVQAIWMGNLGKSELRKARLDAIKALLMEKDWKSAYYAMLRFGQDYHPVTVAEAELFVGGLLDADMAKESVPWLVGLDEKDPVRVRVELETGLISAVDAMKLAGNDPGILQIAARSGKDPVLDIRAKEAQAAAGKIDGKNLWQSYLDHAPGFSNQYALLQGNYGSWPDSIAKITDPYAARSLLAYLSTREKDHEALAALVGSLKGEPRVALVLFSGRIDLPLDAKAALGEMAYDSGDFASCINFWKDLPLQKEDPLKLAFAYARTGQSAKASSMVEGYFKGKSSLDPQSSSLALAALKQISPPPKSLLDSLLQFADPSSKRRMLMYLGRISTDPEAAAAYYFQASTGKRDDPAGILCIESLKEAGLQSDAKALAEKWK